MPFQLSYRRHKPSIDKSCLYSMALKALAFVLVLIYLNFVCKNLMFAMLTIVQSMDTHTPFVSSVEQQHQQNNVFI